MSAALIGLIIAGAVSAITGVTGAILNRKSAKEANETNKKLQEETNAANAQSVADTNETNIALARENREFEANMANTAVQRAAADYEAAGFNRMLAVDHPASTPVVSAASTKAAQADAPQVSDIHSGAALQSLASTAQSMAFMMALQHRADGYNQTRKEIYSNNHSARDFGKQFAEVDPDILRIAKYKIWQ